MLIQFIYLCPMFGFHSNDFSKDKKRCRPIMTIVSEYV